MTDEERRDFQELVKRGNFEELIPAWCAWWEQEVQLVHEINPESEASPPYMVNCPKLVKVPPLSELTVMTCLSLKVECYVSLMSWFLPFILTGRCN